MSVQPTTTSRNGTEYVYQKQGSIAIFLLAVGLVFTLFGCNVTTSVPQKSTANSASAPDPLAGFTMSEHFRERMHERGVSIKEVADVIKNGQRFYDPNHNSSIRWKNGIYVALTDDGVLKTVIRGPVLSRWQPQ